MLSSKINFFISMQQRICNSARVLGVQFGQHDPYVLAASREQVILLPSSYSSASIHGQLKGRSV